MCFTRTARSLLPLGVAWILCAAALASARAQAEIIVFNGGSFTKISAFEVEGERVRLTLPSGGVVVMPLLRVARILDDEIVSEPPPPEPELVLTFDPAQPPLAVPYGDLIHAAAARHDLNPVLVSALVGAESAFDANAVSSKGARGLMQLMPATAERFGLLPQDVFDPERNLDAGTRYLAWLTRRFKGRLPWILAAYNAGEGTVERFGGVPPYRETRAYLQRIYATLGLTIEPDQHDEPD